MLSLMKSLTGTYRLTCCAAVCAVAVLFSGANAFSAFYDDGPVWDDDPVDPGPEDPEDPETPVAGGCSVVSTGPVVASTDGSGYSDSAVDAAGLKYNVAAKYAAAPSTPNVQEEAVFCVRFNSAPSSVTPARVRSMVGLLDETGNPLGYAFISQGTTDEITNGTYVEAALHTGATP